MKIIYMEKNISKPKKIRLKHMKWKTLFLTLAIWLLGGSMALAQNPPTYKLTVEVTPFGNGEVTFSSDGPYVSGTTVTLTPSPASGFTFIGWSDGWVDPTTGLSTPRTVTVTGDATYTAVFSGSGIVIHGSVFGGGEGTNATIGESTGDMAQVITVVNMNDGLVEGDLFGGGALGQVNGSTSVAVSGGEVGVLEYIYKKGNTTHTVYDSIRHVNDGGHVFGGGLGDESNYNVARVMGNATVAISGGHVQYNVYGGGEMGSVGQSTINYVNNDPAQGIASTTPVANTGLATVTITGGQVGPAPKNTSGYNIPIGLDGTDGYVFGGGKGQGDDPMSTTYPSGQFILHADVNNTNVTVNITNADTTNNRIWGSVFGGAEDGHVLGNAQMNYYSGYTGTLGTTSYDGNIFGGGRNYSKKNYAAGRVGGNVNVLMTGGQVFGTIFGGGRLAMTGAGVNGIYSMEGGRYGAMLPGSDHGKVTVQVQGGTVGNDKYIRTFTKYSMGDVYGGGKGSMEGIAGSPAASALLVSLCKNTEVEISGTARILGSVFGGGEVACVGNNTWAIVNNTIGDIEPTSEGHTKVTISGGTIGIDNMRMDYEIAGTAGDHNYNLKNNYDVGHVFGGGEGIVDDPTFYFTVNPTAGTPGYHNNVSLLDLMASVNSTEVIITGSAFVKGSVYGGAENGHVFDSTYVKVEGGQIGCGEGWNTAYDPNQFINPLTTTVTSGTGGNALAECPYWPYNPNTNYPFDPILIKDEGKTPSDGRTYFGNVFGGGSGYYPYIKKTTENNVTTYETQWNPRSGVVEGHSRVWITGGHILTSVYGGCETTDVKDKATVVMEGGTLGVPRTDQQMKDHPVTCYLFGAGKGDSRVYFNQWTNVASTEVRVKGGTIYGSVFGGGEEGHVLGDAVVNISQPAGKTTIIGTTGTSYVDGNVFGGGRGFSGEARTAGVVCGDVSLTISGGTMLGSIYGGGRLASVGTYLVQPYLADGTTPNPRYGKMQPDKTNESHGHVVINISGGTIGNDAEAIFQSKAHNTGGNVFGGAMGRLELLNGDVNENWPYLAKVKDTHITISQTAAKGTTIKGNVYGGAELGTVTTDSNHPDTIPMASTTVTVQNGTIWGSVFGGSYGSDNTSKTADITITLPGASQAMTYSVTPMKHAGCVFGNTNVYFQGGWIKKSIYGGGEFASVGFITSATEHPATGANIHPFNLSWPCEFTYATGTGEATVNVTGGRLGLTGEDFMGPWILDGTEYKPAHNGQAIVYSSIDDLEDYEQDNGDIYGGGKGVAGDRFEMAYLANVKQATVTITYPETLPTGQTAASPSNFKPEDDIIVPISNMEDWSAYTSKPCVAGAVYGGGENGHVNEDTWVTLNRGLVGHAIYGGGKGKDKYETSSNAKDYSYTAGKVYGNTHVTINGGNVVRSVFGGGNLASVGKGNYNRDSYNTTGMGESTTDTDLLAIAAASGHTYVNIYNGTLGMLNPDHPDEVFKDNIPYGSVFGGCRGKVASDSNNPNSVLSHTGFVNYTHVNIGNTTGTDNPRLYGSVYGGAQDGHVRYETEVIVNRGVVGVEFGGSEAVSNNATINGDPNSTEWKLRGNVYGGGSGISTYTSGSDNLYSRYSGSVLQKTNLTVNGGTIHNSVYGGGNLSLVGPPDVIGTDECTSAYSCATVNVNNVVGTASEVASGYGGNVFGASRGRLSNANDPDYTNPESFSRTVYTQVNINTGADVKGNVYGGGELGQVRQSTDVNINDGTVQGNVFGSGKGNDAANLYACVKVNTDVTMEGGQVKGSVYGGGEVASVGTYSDGGGGVIACAPNTGTAYVTVTGGQVGTNTQYTIENFTASTTYPTIASWFNDDDNEPARTDVGHVYGGGKGEADDSHTLLCDVNNTQVTIGTQNQTSGGPTVYGSVYGGAANGHVLNNTNVTFHSGTIGTLGLSSWDGHIFGGGEGSMKEIPGANPGDDPTHTPYRHCGRVGGNPTITMDGGHLWGSIYGGGRIALTGVGQDGNYNEDATKGKTTINVSAGTLGNDNSEQLLDSDFSIGDIFGSGRGDVKYYESVSAGCVTNTEINVSGNPTIYGSVFGGGEMACVGYKHIVGNGFPFWANTGHAEITIEGSPTIGTAYEYTYVMPDPNNPTANDNPGQWTIYNEDGTLFHTCTGNVFGGCQGDIDLSSEKWVSMGSSYSSKVTINGGTIMSSVFGGPEQGTMLGDAEVVIEPKNNNTILIGTVVEHPTTHQNYNFGQVYGGGYGSDDPADNLTTYVPDPVHHPGVTASVVHDSIAARDALHLPWTADYFAGRVYGDVSVKLLGGTIQGDVYGGGSLAYVGYEPSATKGNATLDIGAVDVTDPDNPVYSGEATILGNVYGANNQMGSPFGNINVNIYKTAHTTTNAANYDPTTNNNVPATYAIDQVFGGGNRANYTPTQVNSSKTLVNGITSVHVYTCDNTIREIFGGGNSANVGALDFNPVVTGNQLVEADTRLTIDGGRIDRVFGGGNGPTAQYPANIYGTAYTNVFGGTINQVFGGSNQNGSITETNMLVDDSQSACPSDINEIYGGSNEGDIEGNITTTIACGNGLYDELYGGALNASIGGNVTLNVYGNTITNLFGGSKGTIKPANIGGNVTLNLYGGTIATAYGGSNIEGNVGGVITVNVLDHEASGCMLDITNLYGGCNQATHITTLNDSPVKNSPVINVMHIAQTDGIKGNVFGGGMGVISDLTKGAVTANPIVNIGYDASTQSGLLPTGFPATSQLTDFPRAVVSGHVHGGGDLASTTGNTTVNIRENSTLLKTNVFGGGHGNETNANAAKITGNTLVNMTAGTVKENIYGGGELASVCSDSPTNKNLGIAKVTISGGTVGDETVTGQGPDILGNVFGGGLGRAGDAFRNWANVDSTRVEISGQTTGDIVNPYIVNTVFGGAENGHVERSTSVVVSGGLIGKKITWEQRKLDDEGQVTTYVYTGNVLGGGRGIDTDANGNLSEITGRVFGNTNVTISGGVVRHSVYGGAGLASVGTYTKDENDNFVFANNTGKATVTVNGTALIGPKKGDLIENPSVQDSSFKYLGCNEGCVYGSGCGLPGDTYKDYAFTNKTEVTIGGNAQVVGSAFGGGENGYVQTEAKIVVEGNAVIGGIPLHGTATETSYTVNEGENNEYNGVTVNLKSAEGECTEDAYGTGRRIFRGNVYGGSRGTDYADKDNKRYSKTTGRVYGHTNVTIQGNAKVYNRVYGGGAIASVGDFNYHTTVTDSVTSVKSDGVTNVTVKGNAIVGTNGLNNGEVYGGGRGLVGKPMSQVTYLAYVGNTNVTVSETAQIKGNVYGGSASGHVQEDARVTVSGGTIGIANQGGFHSNVYGGGGGAGQYRYVTGGNVHTHHSISAGRVFGDTHVEINSGTIHNNVYGGGAVASVGSYDLKSTTGQYIMNNTGKANVTIKGGTVHNVFGSGRGSVSDPAVYQFFDSLSYAAKTFVNIGPDNSNPIVSGSVYGSGENGHVFEKATVNVYSGTINGSVYGAGKGIDSYDNDPTHTNPLSGVVQGTTEIQLYGGTVYYNVYGGGENGQVYQSTDVHIRGGNIGIDGQDNGNVYGASKGIANVSWNVGNANVGVSTTVTLHTGTIKGSLFGGGENGSVGFGAPSGTTATSTVNVEGGTVLQSVYGGGRNGFNTGNTFVNMTDGEVKNHIFGGAYGAVGQVYVKGLRMVNMRGGLVKGNVYGGSFNADDAVDAFHAFNASNWEHYTGTTQACVVNYSGGHTEHHVFGSGYRGRTYGSSYVFVGTNAIMNAPNHTATTGNSDPYNQAFYEDHQDLVIDRDVWAGADYGDYDPNVNTEFGAYTVTGRSDIYIDGLGYDTEHSSSQNDDTYMILRNSVFGCGTLNDGGHQGKRIMIRNYGHATVATSSTEVEPWAEATRTIHSIQYADSVIIASSHINFQGRGIVENFGTTEKYAIYSVFNDLRLVNGSSLFIEKPIKNISNLYSNHIENPDNLYAAEPTYIEVGYSDLITYFTNPSSVAGYDNKIRINKGTFVSVTQFDANNNGFRYGALKGFMFLMTDGPYNAFAYARPKQSNETGNIISPAQISHAYNDDGGFVSYRPSLNIYDAEGYLVSGGNSIQMRYENHTPNQSKDDVYDPYFRVWRFNSTNGQSTFDVVLHAIAKPSAPNGFSYYTAIVELPPQAGEKSYYRIKNANNSGVAAVNYGSEIKTVSIGMQDKDANWMMVADGKFNYKPKPEALVTQQEFMTDHPTNAFGLTAIPVGGFIGGSNNKPWLFCTEANTPLINGRWNNLNESVTPQIEFLLTHSNDIDGNYAWDPLAIVMEQVNKDGEVTDEVTINVTITTSTVLEQTNKAKTYAIMTHPKGTGNPEDIYKARVLIPSYSLAVTGENSVWTLTNVVWEPNTGFNNNTLVSGQPVNDPSATPTKNFVGMTMCPAVNFDNVNGWWDATDKPIDLGSSVYGIGNGYLGSTDGVNPISFDFDLLFDGDQKIPPTDNAFMGTVKVTAHVTNYINGDANNNYGKDVHFEIEVYRRGKGKGFYIDGVDGDFVYSGKFPNAAQPSLAGILYFAEDYEPVDSIYIVNKVTADAAGTLTWSTPFTQIKLFRYNGGHPLFAPQNQIDNTPYYAGYSSNPLHNVNQAYKGALVDVVTSMSISSAIIDGAYLLDEMNQLNNVVTAEHVCSEAPLINILAGGTLTLDGVNGTTVLQNNYNNAGHGGAINIAADGTLKMNRRTYLENNYVKDGGSAEHHGGGVYMANQANMLVSDDVMIKTNVHVDNSNKEANENVYITGYNTVLSVGTMDDKDTYGALNEEARIGVTKVDWDDQEYMPVVFAENFAHASNLFGDRIVFDEGDRYFLTEYPERFPNGDPSYLNKLYWVKTWVDHVTEAPATFDASSIDTPEELAWAISIVNGLNDQQAAPGSPFTITGDIDMSQYFWVPIGDATHNHQYTGTFEGNGHLVTGIHSPFSMTSKGMFGTTATGADIKNLQAKVDFYMGEAQYLGGIIGNMEGGTLSNCESAGYLESGYTNTGFIGGLVGGTVTGSVIHSCFATNTLKALSDEMYLGGLVGEHSGGNLYNSYSRVLIAEGSTTPADDFGIGGLTGYNDGMVQNCYADLGSQTFPAFTYYNHTGGKVWYCYANERSSGVTNPYVKTDNSTNGITGHGTYEPVVGIKTLGYMYGDNKVNLDDATLNGTNTAHTSNAYVPVVMSYQDHHTIVWNGLLSVLNQWVTDNPVGLDPAPTPWFRSTSVHVNADLPVLGFPKDNAMATLDTDGRFLQYSATSYDSNHANVGDNGLDGLLVAYKDQAASIFLYDNAINVTKWPVGDEKVFVNEDAVLLQAAGVTNAFGNTTVGITFDNSSKEAHDYFNNPLDYDWHLMSTPLSDAKMGTTYGKVDQDNQALVVNGNYIPHTGDDIHYQTDLVDIVSMENGYFPNGLTMGAGNQMGVDDVLWDFYCYYEPEYHWVNLKRNKKNHFHWDAIEGQVLLDNYGNMLPFQWDISDNPYFKHYQIQYDGTDQSDTKAGDDGCVFTPGKGYMMAISQDSYLSNTGTLNNGEVSIHVTAKAPYDDQAWLTYYPSHDKGSNLVGNPYQAYLDLDKVSTTTVNQNLNMFWVYDADLGLYTPYTYGSSVNWVIPSTYIHPHQGFFVFNNTGQEDVEMTFTPDMAGTNKESNSYFRNRPNYPLVNLFVADEEGNRDLTIVEFNRPEVGGVPKIENLQNASFKLYARFEDQSYGLLFTPQGTQRVPVFFRTPNSGTYTLTWDKQNGIFNRMRLIDNITGVDYDMLANDHYTFQAFNTDYAARFYIVFDVTSVDEIDEGDNFAYFNGTGWVVEGQGVIQLVDVLGHVLYSDYLSGESTIVDFGDVAAGVYMLKLGNMTQKIVIY